MVSLLPTFLSMLAILAGVSMAQDDRPGLVMTCSKPGVFALTFDDGPSQYTKTLLDLLEKENIKATFFVLGKAVDEASTGHWAKDAYDKGHQIAIHTYDHPHLNSLTADAVKSQITRTEQALQKVIGTIPNYFRPPYGECSPANQKILEDMGYMIVQWNVDSNDWRYMSDPKKFPLVTTNFKKALARMDGHASAAISLQHDIHKFSIDQTQGIIQMIKEKGFIFQTVADCIGNVKPYYRSAPDPQGATSNTTADPSSVSGAAVDPNSPGSKDDTNRVKGASASEATRPESLVQLMPYAIGLTTTVLLFTSL